MAEQKGKRTQRFKREKPEFDQQIIDLARVTRVTKGGKQMSFRATVLIGDRRGRVGFGVEKGKDVQGAVEKAVNQAKKHMITVPIMYDTVPHWVEAKYKAAKVLIKPAPKGSGIIAGSSVRAVLEMAGVYNASAKVIGKTNNKLTNLKAAFAALQSFHPRAVAAAQKGRGRKNEVPVTAEKTTEPENIESASAKAAADKKEKS